MIGVLDTMVTNRTKRRIETPIRLIFSDSGVTYFVNQGHKLQRFNLVDDKQEHGIQLVDFEPQTVQKMMLLGFVNKIETAVDDIVAGRHDLIDLSKLVTYGMLYRQFDTVVFEKLLASDLVTSWNRRHIKHPIGFDTPVNHRYLNHVFSQYPEELARLKERVRRPAYTAISKKEHLTADERRILELTCEKYLDSLNPLTWFLLLVGRGSPAARPLVAFIQSRLVEYISKTAVTEYFALMLIELLNVVRSEITMEEEAPGPVYLLWRLRARRKSVGDRAKLHLIISNNRTRYEEMRQVLNNRANVEVKGKSLYDFYSDGAELSNSINLGLYYLSFLSEECKRENIRLESFVNHGSGGKTMVHLTLVL